jgi:hypothetical protein
VAALWGLLRMVLHIVMMVQVVEWGGRAQHWQCCGPCRPCGNRDAQCQRHRKGWLCAVCVHLASDPGRASHHPRCLQVGHVLSSDPTGRTAFVQSGGLAAVLAMAEANPGLREPVEAISGVYPEDVVQYYSPSYSQQLLQKLETLNSTPVS